MDEVTAPAITLDAARRIAFRRGRAIALGPAECRALQLLLEADGRPVGAADLFAQIWGGTSDAQLQKVREVIRRLRLKLRERNLIETIGGEGYRLADSRQGGIKSDRNASESNTPASAG